MRKLLLVGFALMAFSGANAQFNKGRMLAGGSVGFSSLTEKSTFSGTSTTIGTYTNFSFGPSFGYFVMDNLAVGAGLAWASQKFSPNGSGSSNTTSAFAFAPFVRYYVAPGFFGQGTFGFGSSKNESSSSTTKGTVTQWSLGVGYAVFLNDYVAVEPMILYQSNSTKYDSSGDPKDDQSGLAINVGFRVYLGERK